MKNISAFHRATIRYSYTMDSGDVFAAVHCGNAWITAHDVTVEDSDKELAKQYALRDWNKDREDYLSKQ